MAALLVAIPGFQNPLALAMGEYVKAPVVGEWKVGDKEFLVKKLGMDQAMAWLFSIFLSASLFGGLFFLVSRIARDPLETMTEHLDQHKDGGGLQFDKPRSGQSDNGGQARSGGDSLVASGGSERSDGSGEGFVEWGYKGVIGPEFWGGLADKYLDCRIGQQQSPVDLNNPVVDRSLPPLGFRYEEADITLKNTGQMILASWPSGRSDLAFNGKAYNLVEISFHGPSEHTVDGIPYDLEMHLRHTNADGSSLILGVFFEEGPAYLKSLEKLWESLPVKAGGKGDRVHLNLHELLPENRSYYAYMGSMTIPPCREGVQWIILRQPLKISSSQVDQFIRAYRHNARTLQGIHHRTIKVSAP